MRIYVLGDGRAVVQRLQRRHSVHVIDPVSAASTSAAASLLAPYYVATTGIHTPPMASRISVAEERRALTHLIAWEDLVGSRSSRALVIEGSTLLTSADIETMCGLLQQNTSELSYLGYVPVPTLSGTKALLISAYLVSKEGALRLLRALPIDRPLDYFLDEVIPRARCERPLSVRGPARGGQRQCAKGKWL